MVFEVVQTSNVTSQLASRLKTFLLKATTKKSDQQALLPWPGVSGFNTSSPTGIREQDSHQEFFLWYK